MSIFFFTEYSFILIECKCKYIRAAFSNYVIRCIHFLNFYLSFSVEILVLIKENYLFSSTKYF